MTQTIASLQAKITADTSGLTKGLAETNAKLNQMSANMSNVGKAVMGLGGAVIGAQALGSAFGVAKGAMIDLNASIENVEAQLNAFTKDGAKSAAILADIRAEADRTPFAFQEMAKATASLMSSAKQANEPLMALVRTAEILAASNPSEGLAGAAFALREAVSGDFTSIIERFNLPRSYINQLKAEGVPALEAVRKAMQQMGYDADLVGNLAKTATGKWSTFSDTLSGIGQKAGQQIFERIKAALTSMQGALDENKVSIDAWASAFGAGLGGVVDAASKAGSAVVSLTRFVGEHKEVQAALVPVVTALATAYTIAAAKSLTYVVGITAIETATKAWTIAQAALNFVMNANPLVRLISLLAGLVAIVIWAYNNIKPFREAVDRAWAALREMFKWVGDVADAIGKFLNPSVEAATAGTDAYARAARTATTASSDFRESLDRLHRSTNMAGSSMRLFNDDITQTSRMLPEAEYKALKAAEAFRNLEQANRAAAAAIVAKNYGTTPFAEGPDDPKRLRQEHRDLLGLASGSKYLNSQMDYLTQQMTALNQANDLYGIGSTQSRAIMQSMSPVIDDVRKNYSNLTEAQKAVAAAAAGAQRSFTASLPETKEALKEQKDAIKEAESALKAMTAEAIDASIALHPAMLTATAATKAWQEQVDVTSLAITANKDQVQAAQAEYQRMSARLGELNTRLSDARQRLTDLGNVRLPGMQELDDQLFNIDQQLKQLQLQKLLGSGSATAINKQIAALERQRDVLRLQGEIANEPGMRQIKQAMGGVPAEMGLGDALSAIAGAKREISGLTGEVEAQEAAMKAQQAMTASLQAATDALNRTLATQQEQLKESQDNQKRVNDLLKMAYDWFGKDREAMMKAGAAGETTAAKLNVATVQMMTSLDTYIRDLANGTIGNLNAIWDIYMQRRNEALAGLVSIQAGIPGYGGASLKDRFGANYNEWVGNGGSGNAADFAQHLKNLQQIGAFPGDVPIMDNGGIATGPTAALLAMNGRPEAVIPLGSGRSGDYGGGIDYDKLAAALAKHPIRIEMDGRELARLIRPYTNGLVVL